MGKSFFYPDKQSLGLRATTSEGLFLVPLFVVPFTPSSHSKEVKYYYIRIQKKKWNPFASLQEIAFQLDWQRLPNQISYENTQIRRPAYPDAPNMDTQ